MTANDSHGLIPSVENISSLKEEAIQATYGIGQEWSDYAQETLNVLPRTWTRGILYFLVMFLSITIPWAAFSKVDEVGSAQGRLELQGRTIRKEADIPGSVAVTAVYVKEGDIVQANQVLLELDSTALQDELAQLETRQAGQEDRVAQLDALKNQVILALGIQQQQNQLQELEKQAQVNQARQTLDTSVTSYNFQKVERLAPIDQAEQALADSRKAYELAEIRVKAAQREVDRYRSLYEQGAVPEIQVREMEATLQGHLQQRNQAEADIQQGQLRLQEQQRRYQSSMHQADSDVKQARLRLEEQQSSYESLKQASALAISRIEQQRKEIETQITDLRSEMGQTKTQIVAIQDRLEKYTVRAPVDGVLFQFPVKQPGAVLQPKDLIAEVAPQSTRLIFRGQIPTSQSESLRSSQSHRIAKLKFDEFPFQDYGVVTGTLVNISPDSRLIETAQGRVTVYDIEVELQEDCIPTADACIPFKAGQPATADVVIRQRRIIDLLLDPFQRLRKGEFRL